MRCEHTVAWDLSVDVMNILPNVLSQISMFTDHKQLCCNLSRAFVWSLEKVSLFKFIEKDGLFTLTSTSVSSKTWRGRNWILETLQTIMSAHTDTRTVWAHKTLCNCKSINNYRTTSYNTPLTDLKSLGAECVSIFFLVRRQLEQHGDSGHHHWTFAGSLLQIVFSVCVVNACLWQIIRFWL